MIFEKILYCGRCGITEEDDDSVSEVFDPYYLEIYNEQKKVVLCETCYLDRCSDI